MGNRRFNWKYCYKFHVLWAHSRCGWQLCALPCVAWVCTLWHMTVWLGGGFPVQQLQLLNIVNKQPLPLSEWLTKALLRLFFYVANRCANCDLTIGSGYFVYRDFTMSSDQNSSADGFREPYLNLLSSLRAKARDDANFELVDFVGDLLQRRDDPDASELTEFERKWVAFSRLL